MSPAYRRWKVWGGVGRILYVWTTSTHPYVNVSALYSQKRKDGKDIWASSGACIMHMARLCVFNAIGIYPHTQIGSPPKMSRSDSSSYNMWNGALLYICIFFSFFNIIKCHGVYIVWRRLNASSFIAHCVAVYTVCRLALSHRRFHSSMSTYHAQPEENQIPATNK
jgi:hypothetical protein